MPMRRPTVIPRPSTSPSPSAVAPTAAAACDVNRGETRSSDSSPADVAPSCPAGAASPRPRTRAGRVHKRAARPRRARSAAAEAAVEAAAEAAAAGVLVQVSKADVSAACAQSSADAATETDTSTVTAAAVAAAAAAAAAAAGVADDACGRPGFDVAPRVPRFDGEEVRGLRAASELRDFQPRNAQRQAVYGYVSAFKAEDVAAVTSRKAPVSADAQTGAQWSNLLTTSVGTDAALLNMQRDAQPNPGIALDATGEGVLGKRRAEAPAWMAPAQKRAAVWSGLPSFRGLFEAEPNGSSKHPATGRDGRPENLSTDYADRQESVAVGDTAEARTESNEIPSRGIQQVVNRGPASKSYNVADEGVWVGASGAAVRGDQYAQGAASHGLLGERNSGFEGVSQDPHKSVGPISTTGGGQRQTIFHPGHSSFGPEPQGCFATQSVADKERSIPPIDCGMRVGSVAVEEHAYYPVTGARAGGGANGTADNPLVAPEVAPIHIDDNFQRHVGDGNEAGNSPGVPGGVDEMGSGAANRVAGRGSSGKLPVGGSSRPSDHERDNSVYGLKCFHCDEVFDDGSKRDGHVRLVHVRPFGCPLCSSTFTRKFDLEKHTMTVHEGKRPWVCTEPLCQQAFGQKHHLSRHIKAVHQKSKPFQCEQCMSTFGRKEHLSNHVRSVHQKEKPFTCPLCDIQYCEKRALKKHLVSIHKVKDSLVETLANLQTGTKAGSSKLSDLADI